VYKLVLGLFLIIATSYARENPFFPADGVKDLPMTSNQATSFEPLKRATITLPNSARVLEKVTIQYKNLDGSVETKSIALGQSIDWHLPLFISQSYASDTQAPQIQTKQSTSKKAIVKLASFRFISFYQSDKKLIIKTKDKLIRDFMLPSPHRIILDFKRNADFRSHIKSLKEAPFTKIRMGNHKGYYRVVVELDGQYHYRKVMTKTGLEITCY